MTAAQRQQALKRFYKTHTWVSNGYPDCRWVHNDDLVIDNEA